MFDLERVARKRAFSKSQIGNLQSEIHLSAFAKATARQPRKFSELEARGFEPLTSSLQSWRSTN
jgi:hypothetical protein